MTSEVIVAEIQTTWEIFTRWRDVVIPNMAISQASKRLDMEQHIDFFATDRRTGHLYTYGLRVQPSDPDWRTTTIRDTERNAMQAGRPMPKRMLHIYADLDRCSSHRTIDVPRLTEWGRKTQWKSLKPQINGIDGTRFYVLTDDQAEFAGLMA